MTDRRTLKERLKQLLTDLRWGWAPLDDGVCHSDVEMLTKIVLGLVVIGVVALVAWCESVGIQMPPL